MRASQPWLAAIRNFALTTVSSISLPKALILLLTDDQLVK